MKNVLKDNDLVKMVRKASIISIVVVGNKVSVALAPFNITIISFFKKNLIFLLPIFQQLLFSHEKSIFACFLVKPLLSLLNCWTIDNSNLFQQRFATEKYTGNLNFFGFLNNGTSVGQFSPALNNKSACDLFSRTIWIRIFALAV